MKVVGGGGVAAQEIRRGVCRLMVDMGLAPLCEVSLRTGRRVDVMALADSGALTIVEIKSSVADFRSDHKWPEYLDFADHFYFAVDTHFPQDLLPAAEGLIVADAYGGAIVRESQQRSVAGTRRRSLLLRFARHGALRLARLEDPGLDHR